jgi:hypothetical protein
MKDGGWLDKFQEGGELDKYIATKVPKTFGKNVAASESTGVNKVLPTDPTKLKLIRQAEEDAKIARERRARINLANSAEANDWDKPVEDLALQTSATADKLRFSDYPNWFDDSMLNPIPTFGPMVSGLGRIPLDIKKGNYGDAALNFAAPILAGAGEAYAEMLLKPVMDPLMAYGKDAAKKYVLNPAVKKLNSVLGRQAAVPSMGPYMMPNHAIDDLTGTNIGRNITQDFGIDQVLFNNPEVADYLKLPYYEPGSGSGLFPTTAKTTKEFNKLIYDKNLTHLYQRNKLMHGCGSAAECAKIANAITSTVNRQVSPDDVFDYSANADNAWYSTSQMLRNDGELIYNEGLHGPLNSDVASKLQVGDQIMLGPDYGTPHPNVSPATGNFKEPNVNHRATVAGVDDNGNVLINESFDGRLVTVPLQNNLYYNANSNLGIRSIVRPSQFVGKAPDIAKRAMLNDINLNTGTMDFGVSPELQSYKEVYDKVKPTLIGNLGIHADEADQIFRHVLGIGIQESKMSGKLAKGLPKAKVIIQDKLREAGLTKPIKEVMNAIKTFGNRKYEPNPDLLDFPGKSKMQMEASKLAEKEGIEVSDALEQLYTTTYNRPKPFALSDTDPSVGAFRQKHLSKTAERLGLTEDSHKIGEGTSKNVFYNNPENELTAAFANFYDLKRNLAKKHPDWDQQKLFDMATLSWNSPSKANNEELIKYFYDFADNPKFEGFDYLNKVKSNIKTYAPLKSVTPTTEVNFTKPFLQFKDGGWLEKYNDGGPVQENYNDASVSMSDDFVGDGYSNVGRNYSPAWGGQFQDGGQLPQFQPGGKVKPIIVNDKNDARLRAYQDSLSLYNTKNYNLKSEKYSGSSPISSNYVPYNKLTNRLNNNEYFEIGDYSPSKSTKVRVTKQGQVITSDPDTQDMSIIIDNKISNKDELSKKVNPKIKPIGFNRTTWGNNFNQYSLQYKKPTQPIVYEKPKPIPTSQAIIDWIEGNGSSEEYVPEVEQLKTVDGQPFGFVQDIQTGYTHMYRKSTGELEIPFRGGQTHVDPKNPRNNPKPKMAMGGSLPGAVGFTYARTGGIPSNGPYAKKTKASAQDGTTIYSGMLPEITVVGSKDPQTEEFYRNMMDRLTKEEGYRQGIIPSSDYDVDLAFDDPISTNNILSRYQGLMDLGKKYGFPKVHPKDPDSIFSVASKLSDTELDSGPRPNYNPFTKTIQASTSKNWLDEMAHHVQFKNNPISTGLKFLTNDVPAYISGKSPYRTSGTMEHEAHSIIEPKLEEEIETSKRNYRQLPYIQKLTEQFYGPIENYQNGGEMRYYQEGLDFQPKTISKDGGWLSKYEEGGVIQDDMGQWAHPGEITEIGSNQITMQGVPYPVLGISDTGDMQMMYPNQEYQYDGSSVTEYPMMKEGGALQLTKLDQLTNFTNYNTKQPGGWLDKYQD